MEGPARHLRLLLFRSGVLLLLLTLLRWVFFLANRTAFPLFGWADVPMVVLQGLRFDAMTVVIAALPLILLHLLPLPWRERSGFQRALFIYFLVVNGFLLFLCCVDLPFYGFNGKRLTRDILGQAGAGARTLPLLLVRYWWATSVFLLCILTLVRGWERLDVRIGPKPRARAEWGLLALAVGPTVLLARGGWQYQGLSPAHAADHVPVGVAPLVTNSAFTFGYSLLQPTLREHPYMTEAELDQRMPLDYVLRRDTMDRARNVVVLIVESWGREYLGSLDHGKPRMPFLDSLAARSLVLTNAYANAERSNKSMCAILAGIPSFTDDAFMNTPYGDDRVQGLGTALQRMGYSTAFFHGGLNGEYKFDSFSRACGFERYYGKDEFADDRYYDGHWGIYDEEFLQFVVQRLGELPQPFGAVEFTLSSHDPFPIPARWKGVFPKGDQEIHESLGYVDMALRRFFAAARTQPWFQNTVFVLTGDHTFQYNVHPPWYSNPAGRFAVPILFHAGDGSLHGTDARVAQHLDLVPSILDLVGYEGTIRTFGQSVFRRDRPDRAVQFLGGRYQLLQEERMLLFDGERTLGLFDPVQDTLFQHDLQQAEPAVQERLRGDLEALIQRHAEAVTRNQLTAP